MRTLLVLAACCMAQAQSFEVASVKASPPGGGTGMSASRSEIRWQGTSLKQYIQTAFGVIDYGYSGPAWLDTACFDIVAKLPAGAPFQQFPAMLQTLLAERFHLTAHRELHVVNAYSLVVGKSGLKLQPVEPGPGSMSWFATRLVAKNSSMAQFADMLSQHLDRPVQDQTSVAGVFNITAEWLADDAALTTSGPRATTIFGALEEQLGLRLQTGKLPVEVLVVDHVERSPIEN